MLWKFFLPKIWKNMMISFLLMHKWHDTVLNANNKLPLIMWEGKIDRNFMMTFLVPRLNCLLTKELRGTWNRQSIANKVYFLFQPIDGAFAKDTITTAPPINEWRNYLSTFRVTKKHQICVGSKCLKAKSSVKTAIWNDIGGFIDGCSHMSILNHYLLSIVVFFSIEYMRKKCHGKLTLISS